MSYFFTNTDSPGEPLTMARLKEAMDNLRRREFEEAVERGGRTLDFWLAVPVHLRSHPVVLEMAAIVGSGQPTHPNTYERLCREYERLIQES